MWWKGGFWNAQVPATDPVFVLLIILPWWVNLLVKLICAHLERIYLKKINIKEKNSAFCVFWWHLVGAVMWESFQCTQQGWCFLWLAKTQGNDFSVWLKGFHFVLWDRNPILFHPHSPAWGVPPLERGVRWMSMHVWGTCACLHATLFFWALW